MKTKKPKLPSHIAVIWWDDASEVLECETIEELRRSGGYQKVSVGFLTRCDDEYVTVSQELNEDNTFENNTKIPRAMVKRILRYKVIRKK